MIHRRSMILALATLAGAAVAAPNDGKAPAPSPERVKEVEQAIEGWRLAWELGEPDVYLRFYDPAFKGGKPSRRQWEQERRARLKREKITVKVEQLQVKLAGDDRADVRFVQHYTAGKISDVGEKRLKMRRDKGAWRITQETWKAKR